MTADPDFPLGGLSEGEMAALIYRIADELSTRGTRESFAELLRVVAYVGERVGDAARMLAASDCGARLPRCPGRQSRPRGNAGGREWPSGSSHPGAVTARAGGEPARAFERLVLDPGDAHELVVQCIGLRPSPLMERR